MSMLPTRRAAILFYSFIAVSSNSGKKWCKMQNRIVAWLSIIVFLSILPVAIVFYAWHWDVSMLLVSITMYLVIIVAIRRSWKGYHYDCPKCSVSFQPAFAEHLASRGRGEYREMKCPNCGSVIFMKMLGSSESHHQ